jgi:hypothetical protein
LRHRTYLRCPHRAHHLPLAAPVPAKGAGSFESGHRTLPDQVALELGHAGEDLEDQLAALHVHGQIHPRPAREVRDVHIAAEFPLTSAVLPRGLPRIQARGRSSLTGRASILLKRPLDARGVLEQVARVVGLRRCEELLDPSVLHDPALGHHCDLVGNGADKC